MAPASSLSEGRDRLPFQVRRNGRFQLFHTCWEGELPRITRITRTISGQTSAGRGLVQRNASQPRPVALEVIHLQRLSRMPDLEAGRVYSLA